MGAQDGQINGTPLTQAPGHWHDSFPVYGSPWVDCCTYIFWQLGGGLEFVCPALHVCLRSLARCSQACLTMQSYADLQVGDEGLKSLHALHNLRCLGLAGTDVTSESGGLLASFTRLVILDLQWCSIDDAGKHGSALAACLQLCGISVMHRSSEVLCLDCSCSTIAVELATFAKLDPPERRVG